VVVPCCTSVHTRRRREGQQLQLCCCCTRRRGILQRSRAPRVRTHAHNTSIGPVATAAAVVVGNNIVYAILKYILFCYFTTTTLQRFYDLGGGNGGGGGQSLLQLQQQLQTRSRVPIPRSAALLSRLVIVIQSYVLSRAVRTCTHACRQKIAIVIIGPVR